MKARIIRLSVGIILPIISVTLIYGVVNIFYGGIRQGVAIGTLILYATTIIAGIPIVLYSIVMEFLINKKVENIHMVAILSGFLGFLIVIVAFLLFGGFKTYHFARDPYTPVVGMMLGIAMGYLLKHHYDKSS